MLDFSEVKKTDAQVYDAMMKELNRQEPVSYPHLDVYKRQGYDRNPG